MHTGDIAKVLGWRQQSSQSLPEVPNNHYGPRTDFVFVSEPYHGGVQGLLTNLVQYLRISPGGT